MKKRLTTNFLTTVLFLVGMYSMAWSQAQTPLDIALRYVEQNYESMGLSKTDVTDMAVSHQFTSKNNGLTHLYLMQRHADIENLQRDFDGKRIAKWRNTLHWQ